MSNEPRKTGNYFLEGCLICGKPLVYHKTYRVMTCEVCGTKYDTDCCCEDDHFVCNRCHSSEAINGFIDFMLGCEEKDPQVILSKAMELPNVHMHGPEHHPLTAMALLTAFRNNGGNIELEQSLRVAAKRGGNIPGGACGFWGACGAAIGAGIFASIVLGSSPLNKGVWHMPQMVVSECLKWNARIGGPRCCKRTCRTAIEIGADYSTNVLGVAMPKSRPVCNHIRYNKECLGSKCPYFPVAGQRSPEHGYGETGQTAQN